MPSQNSSSRDYDLLDRLVEEFNDRFRKGERPSVKEYCDRHPELADDLREMLPALAQVEQAKEVMAEEALPPLSAVSAESLGDFRIVREVGRGGMGVVYEAEQISLGRRVALKVLTRRLMRDDKQKRRFEGEAKAAARLHHTNIVPVFGTGEAEGVPFYAMQFIQGVSLDVVVEELARIAPGSSSLPHDDGSKPPGPPREVSAHEVARSLLTGAFPAPQGENDPAVTGDHAGGEGGPSARPQRSDGARWSVVLPGQQVDGKARKQTYWQSVARVGVQAADALDHAHKQGVVHRDVKPSNLLLDRHGTVWVTDFGLAKAEGGENLTHTGDVIGTLRYMPPEAFDGKADACGDVYSLGLTLYELVALRPAFDEKERHRLIKQVTTAEAEPLRRRRRGAPRDLETIVHKAIARDPARRYPSAAELRDDLQHFVDDEPIRARRQTLLERFLRWARRHPAVAALLAAVFVSLTAGVAASSVLMIRADNARAGEAQKAKEAEAAEKTALAALAAADAARDAAQREVVKFDITTAAQQAERGELELALHWIARGWQDDQARLKPGQRLDPGAEANHRLRLAAAIDRLPQLVGFCPHDKPVADADCDPTGDRVVTIAATLTRDKSGAEFWTEEREHVARVWIAGRAELAYPPLAHGGPVTSAVFSADGVRIATSSTDGTARVWEAATGKRLHTFRPGGPVARVAFSPDGKTLAAVSGQSVHRWDTATGKSAGAPILVEAGTDYVVYSPEGSRLLTVTLTGKARVWNAATGKALSEPLPFFRFGEKQLRMKIDFNQPMERQRWPAFSADGKQLVTYDGFRIRVWSEAGTKTITPIATSVPMQFQVAFTPSGTQLIYVARWLAPSVNVYDLAAGKVVAAFRTVRLTCGLAISPDGKRVAAPLSMGNTVLFDLPSATVAGPSLRVLDFVTRAQFTRDGRRLLTASWDGTVRVWQPAAHREPEWYRMDCGRADRLEFPDCRFSPDGTWVAAYEPSKRQLWVGRSGGTRIPLPRVDAKRYRFSPGGRHLATFNRDKKGERVVIESWELGGAGPRSSGTTTIQGFVHDLVFSADGRRLGVSVRSPTFKPTGQGSTVDQFFVFDFPSLEPLLGPVGGELIRLTGRLALGRDGGVLVVGQAGMSRLACWDVRTGQRLPGGRVGPGALYSIDVGLRDDRVLAAVSDGTLTQLDARTGRRVGPTILLPVSNTSSWNTATYSPDQTRIAQTVTGKSMSRVHVFSALDGNLLATLPLDDAFSLPDVWFSADNRRVIVHQRGTTHAVAWTLPSYCGPLDQTPALVRLLTGAGSDPVGGFFPLQGDAIRTDPESYRQAFRSDLDQKEQAAAEVAKRKKRMDKLLADPSDVENPETAGRVADCLLTQAGVPATVLKPTRVKSEGGAKLTVQPDGSVLASGINPRKDVYTIDTEVGPGSFPALCLEALPHPSLPANGPGRYGNGNFHLTEISLQAAPADGKGPVASVPFVRAAASYASDNPAGMGGARAAIDGKPETYWHIWPRVGQAHTAWFELAKPVGGTGRTRLTVRLEFQGPSPHSHHTLGRFRLSLLTAPPVRLAAAGRLGATSLDSFGGYARLAAVLAATGRHSPAARVFVQALEAEKTPEKLAAVRKAAVHDAAVFTELVKLRPKDAELWTARGQRLQAEGKKKEAEEAFAQAAKRAPNK